MKIAIWGYGKYGRQMFESLTLFCSEEYEIVRVYDTAYRKLKQTKGKVTLPIYDPEELPEDYKKGLFEKVFISIIYASQKPKQFLRKHSIPELHLGGPEDLYPLSSFEQGGKPFEIQRVLLILSLVSLEMVIVQPHLQVLQISQLVDCSTIWKRLRLIAAIL